MMKKAFVLAAVMFAMFASLWVCWPALQTLHLRWIRFDEPYAIGYPTVLMSLWWLFNRRNAIFAERAAPSFAALPLVLLVLLASAAGCLVQLQIIQLLAVPALLWLVFTALFGWRAGRRALAPFVLLYLAIPFLDIGEPLRAMTVAFSRFVLGLLQIPVFIDGYNISLTAGVIRVAGSCSGFNLLLAALFIGLAQGELTHQRPLRRAMLVALAAVMGVVDNWIRVLSLVLIAHYSAMKADLIYHHGSFGWWVFAISLVPFLLLARLLELPPANAGTSRRAPVEVVPSSLKRMVIIALLIVAMVAVVTAAKKHFERRIGGLAAGFSLPWAAHVVSPGWMPHYSGQDVTQTWRMAADGRDYDVVALTYVRQNADKKLVYYNHYIADEDHLQRAEHLAIAKDFAVNMTVVKDGAWRVAWWFWWVDGKTSTSPLKTKFLQLEAMLTGDPSAALMLASTSCQSATCSDQSDIVVPEQLLLDLRQLQPAKANRTDAP